MNLAIRQQVDALFETVSAGIESPRVIELFVPGIPRPGGSKTACPIGKRGGGYAMKNGRILINMKDSGGEKTASWKADVKYFAARHMQGNPPLDGALVLTITFVMPRIGEHFYKGKRASELRADAPLEHTKKPDATKLTRSSEDALTGVAWTDDARIFKQNIAKIYGDQPGAHISVRHATPEDAAGIFMVRGLADQLQPGGK